MTIEERLDRIEHITAGLAEERRKDRKDYRQLWRETQRQINELAGHVNELTVKLAEANDAITRLADETKGFAEESRAGDKRLEKRIDTLASAIGQFLAAPPNRPSPRSPFSSTSDRSQNC
jgi:predicted RNase H-like nuclease (RuvC/YqgF family)